MIGGGVVFLVVAFLVSLAFTRLMIGLGPRLGLMDKPDPRRVHKTPIPRAGGIAVWLTFVLAMLTLAARGGALWLAVSPGTLAFIGASVALVVVGVVDDRMGVPARVKLVGQIVAAAIYWWLKPQGGHNLFGWEVPWFVDLTCWVAWIVLLINAFNLIDGLDGLCGGLALVSLAGLVALEIANGHTANALMLGVMMTSIGGFMVFNRNPARIFLGDTGSMVLGLFLATMASEAVGRKTLAGAILLPVAVAGVPLIDVLLAVWRRSFRSIISRWNGGEPVGVFSPDKDHLHHRLLALGWSQRKVTRVLHLIAASLAVTAMMPMLWGAKGGVVAATLLSVAMLFGLKHLASVEFAQSGVLVHFAIKRRKVRFRAVYPTYDVLSLAGAALIARVLERNWGSWHSFLEEELPGVAVFAATGMLALLVLRIYRRVWSRGKLRDFVLVAGGLFFAAVVAAAFRAPVVGKSAWDVAQSAILTGSMAGLLVLLPRTLPELVRDMAVDALHRRTQEATDEQERWLVYGAGNLGCLYLEYLSHIPQGVPGRKIVLGLIDDNRALHGRMIRGFEVLGGGCDLTALARELSVTGVILAIDMMDEVCRDNLCGTIRELGLKLRIWQCETRDASAETLGEGGFVGVAS